MYKLYVHANNKHRDKMRNVKVGLICFIVLCPACDQYYNVIFIYITYNIIIFLNIL